MALRRGRRQSEPADATFRSSGGGDGLNRLSVTAATAERLRAFIDSDAFKVHSGIARSEYWKLFGDRLSVEVADSQVKVEGESGFYVPPAASALSRLARRFSRALRQPAKALSWLGGQIKSRFELPRMMPYAQAFDAVMSRADISAPVMSTALIDHAGLARRPQVLVDANAVKRHYERWSGYEASPNIINHYYYQNVLCGFMDPREIGTVLEIGAGNGNFPSILYHDWAPLRVVLIDLPETLAVAIPYLGSLFPEARLALPNEIAAQGFPREFDFAFLTVDQLQLLPDDSIDLAVNCHSFQEMTHTQIDIYFDLIQRVCRDTGLFFCANRIEKVPSDAAAYTAVQRDPPNRMAHYPWRAGNTVLAYEISRLTRLVQLDAVAIRLERIRKPL